MGGEKSYSNKLIYSYIEKGVLNLCISPTLFLFRFRAISSICIASSITQWSSTHQINVQIVVLHRQINAREHTDSTDFELFGEMKWNYQKEYDKLRAGEEGRSGRV